MHRRTRIGILGGSFNPPHFGHIEISLEARRKLGLDVVLWLVSPQNPFKPVGHTPPHSKRVAHAVEFTRNVEGIYVTNIEAQITGAPYQTCKTLRALRTIYTRPQFIWIMGADNMRHFHMWDNWRDITRIMPICVIRRPGYVISAMNSKSIRMMQSSQVTPTTMRRKLTQWDMALPCWTYVRSCHHNISSTLIRAASKY